MSSYQGDCGSAVSKIAQNSALHALLQTGMRSVRPSKLPYTRRLCRPPEEQNEQRAGQQAAPGSAHMQTQRRAICMQAKVRTLPRCCGAGAAPCWTPA